MMGWLGRLFTRAADRLNEDHERAKDAEVDEVIARSNGASARAARVIAAYRQADAKSSVAAEALIDEVEAIRD